MSVPRHCARCEVGWHVHPGDRLDCWSCGGMSAPGPLIGWWVAHQQAAGCFAGPTWSVA